MTDRATILVVGGGHAGGVFALAARRLGFPGDIVILSEEAQTPYERPELSKGLLTGKAAEPRSLAASSAWARSSDLRLRTRAIAIDRRAKRVRSADGSSVPYDTLVLATGAEPRALGAVPHPAVRSLRDVVDARKLRDMARASRSVLVIGGGVIGLEVAASLRMASLDATVVEAGPRLLGRNVPPDAAEWLTTMHRQHGVEILLGSAVARVSRAPEPLRVTLADGRALAPDFVVVGIGVVPRTAIAEDAKLACDDGVLVDETYASVSDRDVYAIGDVAARISQRGPRRQETWAHAQSSAERAARAILGLPAEPEQVPWFWTEQYDRTLQVAGSPDSADDVVARGDGTRLYVRAGAIVGAACLDAPRDFAVARRLIERGARLDAGQAARVDVDLRKALAA